MTRQSVQGDVCVAHALSVVLVHPQIAPNTGNVARLCVATGTPLHLVRPMGFVLSDKQIRRSAMDYWPRLSLTVHDELEAFLSTPRRLWAFSSKAGRSFWDADYRPGDCLMFGSETAGLPPAALAAASGRAVRIPQVAGERCLNLSTAVGVGLFEAIRRITCAGLHKPEHDPNRTE